MEQQLGNINKSPNNIKVANMSTSQFKAVSRLQIMCELL